MFIMNVRYDTKTLFRILYVEKRNLEDTVQSRIICKAIINKTKES